MVDIVLVASYSIVYGTRVQKIIRSLKKRYSISVLGWNREGISKTTLDLYFTKLILMNKKAPYGKLSLVYSFPLFWSWVFYHLLKLNPRVIHACDFDTILPCYLYAVIFRKKIVFDMFDRYAMINFHLGNKKVFQIINYLEEFLAHRVTSLITIGEPVLDTFKRKPKNYVIISNYAEDLSLKNIQKPHDGQVRLVYTGPIIEKRGIEEIISIIKGMENIFFVMAGRPLNKNLFDRIIKIPNVVYKGILPPDESIALMASSDILIALYDLKKYERISSSSDMAFVHGGTILFSLDNPSKVFAQSQKLFEAMMCGVPLITNVSTEVIEDSKCGMLVEYDNIDQIKSVLMSLITDSETRSKLGQNGRKSFEQKYNWLNMENRLFQLYDLLLRK